MTPYIHTLRAITGVFFLRLLNMVAGIFGGIIVTLWAISAICALNFSAWWWLTAIILVPVTVIALLAYFSFRFLAGKVIPRKLSRQEKRALLNFSDKVLGLVEKSKMPIPVLAAWVAKDVVRGRESKFLRETINDSASLRSDFMALAATFDSSGTDVV